MKRDYNSPVVEKVEFSYSEQVVASGGESKTCGWIIGRTNDTGCKSDTHQEFAG